MPDLTPLGMAAQRQQHSAHRRTDSSAAGNSMLGALESLTAPVAINGTLLALAASLEVDVTPAYLILVVLVFALSFPSPARLQLSWRATAVDVALSWIWIGGLLALTGWVTGYASEFSRDVLLHWLWLAPLTEFALCQLLRAAAPLLVLAQGPRQRALIVGMNEQGQALAERLTRSRFCRIEFSGFVDSRSTQRLHGQPDRASLGGLEQLQDLVRERQIHQIYLSIPMTSQPRIQQVLEELKDTTVSVFFVPDMFVTDLIQGHAGSVCDMPVISVCDTPFRGVNGWIKRSSDVLFSILILVLIAPVLLVAAAAVKLTSPGPAIFKQRRYGLDGEEILVYKLRSMLVTEDGPSINQARKGDPRITPLGAFLRRTSMDELPQFINVLQGRMSIVGPRPHAVAHNELYRKLVKGYMVRHKVKPGITGAAQVNGFRGETDTLDKMKARIEHDLDYLRNWSLKLDIQIILKTVALVLRDQKAY